MKTAISISAVLLTLGATYADSVNSAAPLSVSSSSNSPSLVPQSKYEIQLLGSTSLAILNSGFSSLSTGLRYGISDQTNINASYSIQDFHAEETSYGSNNGALRNSTSHHILLGVQTSIVPDYIKTYANIGQGYHTKSLFTDASLGLNFGYINKYLTPFINLEYAYSMAYNQTWVLDNENSIHSDSFRAGNSHYLGYQLGLETQFGKPELGLKLFSTFSTSRVETNGYLRENLEQSDSNVLFSVSSGISYQI